MEISNAMGMCSALRYITLYCELQTRIEAMTYVSVYSGAFPGNAVQTPFDKKLS